MTSLTSSPDGSSDEEFYDATDAFYDTKGRRMSVRFGASQANYSTTSPTMLQQRQKMAAHAAEAAKRVQERKLTSLVEEREEEAPDTVTGSSSATIPVEPAQPAPPIEPPREPSPPAEQHLVVPSTPPPAKTPPAKTVHTSTNLSLAEADIPLAVETSIQQEKDVIDTVSMLRDLETGEMVSMEAFKQDSMGWSILARTGSVEHLSRARVETILDTALTAEPTALESTETPLSTPKSTKKQSMGFFNRFKKSSSSSAPKLPSPLSSPVISIDPPASSPTSPLGRSRSFTVQAALADSPYVKVKVKNKPKARLSRLRLAQELSKPVVNTVLSAKEREKPLLDDVEHIRGAIWVAKMSRCGRYLACAGQDALIRVWCILSELPGEEETTGIFANKPMRKWLGHRGDVVDMAWSKNNFLLSCSMDKTVRLWHVSREDCVFVFQHADFVTCVAFHPKNDRFFLSGSIDGKIRLWSVPEKRIVHWEELPALCTAVAFTGDGKMVVAGTINGLCLFYETDGLKYRTQISSKSHGARGKKVTAIQAFPGAVAEDEKLLITTNDSRLRLFNLSDLSLVRKYKGLQNESNQIRASFSSDGRYIVAGSEDKHVYIWDTDVGFESNNGKGSWLRSNASPPYETFEAHGHTVTATELAPAKTKRLILGEEASVAAVRAMALVVTADMQGGIRVWLNEAPAAMATMPRRPRGKSQSSDFQRSTTFMDMVGSGGSRSTLSESLNETLVYDEDEDWLARGAPDNVSIMSVSTTASRASVRTIPRHALPSYASVRISCSQCGHTEFKRYEVALPSEPSSRLLLVCRQCRLLQMSQ